jgi:DNA-binding response OmpR family regulator
VSYKKALLHVDDDPQFTRLLAHRLSTLGYEVASLNDPLQTVPVLNESHHRLVLLDIDMPKMSGLDLLRQIKTEVGGTQVIMLTGVVSLQTLLQSYRWGAEFCVFKPLEEIQPLVEAIETVFRKIDHWWAALERLGKERRAVKGASGIWSRGDISAIRQPPASTITPSHDPVN